MVIDHSRLVRLSAAFTRMSDPIIHAAMVFAQCVLLLLVLMVVTEVILRTFVGASMLIMDEMAGYMLIALVCAGISHSMRVDALLNVNVVRDRLTGRGQGFAQVLFHAASLLYAVVLLRETFGMTLLTYQRDVLSVSIIAVPLWIPRAVMTLGIFVLCIALIAGLLRSIAQLISGRSGLSADEEST